MGDVVIDGMLVAHDDSGHAAPGPPAVSGIMPPTTPSGQPFTPAPFMYIAKTSKLHSTTATKRTVDGSQHKFAKKGTVMDIEHPGNMPSKPLENTPPNGSDLVSKVSCGQAKIISAGQSTVKVGDEYAAIVGADVVLNIPTDTNTVHQSQSKLLDAGGLFLASQNPLFNPARVIITGDPIAVGSGTVIDTVTDFTLPGMVDLAWVRHYSSARNRERGPLGKGGWRHGFQSWLEVSGASVVLNEPDGARVDFGSVPARGEAFHRGQGLRITRAVESYEVHTVHDRQTREFAPAVAGGPPVLVRVRDRFGNRIELAYEGGHLARVVDTAGREVRLVYDARERITRVEVWARAALQQGVDYAYSDDGDLASVTDALGHRDLFEYDGVHRMVRKKTRAGKSFRYDYHPDDGRCVRSAAEGRLHNVDLHYDDAQRIVTVTGNPEPREYAFGPKGELLRESTLDGLFALEYTYDDDQLPQSITNAAGETWTFAFDEQGHCVEKIAPGGLVTSFEYADDLPVRIAEGDLVTTCAWNAHGAPLSYTSPTGVTIGYEFDRWGRLARTFTSQGLLDAYTYDDEHNLVAFTDARGATTRFEYDALGRFLSQTDALGRKVQNEYDALGRPVREIMRDGTVIEMAYDAADNIIQHGDGHGIETRCEYVGTGSIARQTMPDGQVWEMEYDVLERLREIKNPKRETYEFRYDRAGRLLEERTFDGQTIRFSYSKRDVVCRVDYDDETWVEIEHDEHGNLAKRTSPHGTASFERDMHGRLLKATIDEHGGPVVVESEWNEHNHIGAITQNGRRIEYGYDTLGRIVERTLPNGQKTRYHWDPRGALAGIDHEGEKVLLQRDVLGREVRRHAYGSGVDMRFAYSEDDRLTAQFVTVASAAPAANGAPPAATLRREWHYGPHARVRSILDSRRGTTSYEHDELGRLIQARRGEIVEDMEYDAAGSLVGVRGATGAGETWTVRAGNLVTRTDDARYEYDVRGRRTRKIALKGGERSGEITKYLWDCQDQLREVGLPSGECVLFKYDAFGRRVRKTVIPAVADDAVERPAPRVVEYVWDFDELAMEIDSERGERVFVHQRDSFFPVLQRQGTDTYVYLTDHLGMPKELFDAHGKVAWAATHSAWGKLVEVSRDSEPAAGAVEVSSPFRLLGHYADEETGLAYAMHRYFDPDTGRWISADPLGIQGGPNLFAFDGSPTEHVDPMGLYTRSAFQSFLEKYADKRKEAQKKAEALQAKLNEKAKPIDRNKVAASGSSDGRTARSGGSRANRKSPEWQKTRNEDKSVHAEERLVKDKNGVYNTKGEAVGAGIAHCSNCTHDIIASNNVPATSIRPDWQPTDKQLGLQPGDPSVPAAGRESVPGRNEVPW
jgi:RHS repeat-associated protein